MLLLVLLTYFFEIETSLEHQLLVFLLERFARLHLDLLLTSRLATTRWIKPNLSPRVHFSVEFLAQRMIVMMLGMRVGQIS